MNALHPHRRRWWRFAILAVGCAVAPLLAQEKPTASNPSAGSSDAAQSPAGPTLPEKITIKLVTDFESATLVSDLERLEPVTSTVFNTGGSSEVTIGTKAVLWARNAHIDGKFFFERYYQGKYIGRQAMLEIDAAQLGPGEHTLEPGGHKFTLAEDGALASDDPNIKIDGATVLLKMHLVDIYPVDGAKTGPAEFRKVPATLGLFRFDPAHQLSTDQLPDPQRLFHPQQPPEGNAPIPPLTNLLSEQVPFYPLSVWLPANTQGQGYLLYPSWQAFHLSPRGEVELSAAKAPRVPGVEADRARIVIPYRDITGRVHSHTGLSGGVGAEPLAREMRLGATLEPRLFRAGLGQAPPEDFFLPVDNDLTKRPHKFFVADNTLGPSEQIRLLAVEWDEPVFARAQPAKLFVRLLETPGQPPLSNAELRMDYSLYDPSLPTARHWRPAQVLSWQRDLASGEATFQTPDIPFAFVVFRLQVFADDDTRPLSPLAAELYGSIIEPGQQGTASIISNKGRNAFVAGEAIRLQAALRSTEPRPAGQRGLLLTHPDGHEESLAFTDPGDAWLATRFELPADRTRRLAPGEYALSVTGLPPGIVSIPFRFELAGRQPESLFHVVKSSKYTEAMNQLEPSHLQGRPIDLDRAIDTIARLGYTRVDLMTYMTHRHMRSYTWREDLVADDPRLPPPEAVHAPSPRDQMLNACVRAGLQFSDVWLSYGDFHLPRSIEPYIQASERWIAREAQAMRHSPAYDGMMLYDEMYQGAVTGIVPHHQKYFAKVRARLVEDRFGQPPSKIEAAMNRYLARPRGQRDPQALEDFIGYKDWQQESWAEYVERVVPVARRLAPGSRYGTYTRTWLSPGTNDDMYNGYPPSLFRGLDIISHVHYADNSTCWVSIPLLAQALRTGQGKTLYVNLPLTHEVRTEQDGQYQRHMAFALLQQGANGVAQWGLQHSFTDLANPGTAQGYETTAHLNREILRPFGEINDRTTDGYGQVGILSTLRQHALSEHKRVAVANQTEAIWIACWRLGYPATFVREEHLTRPLSNFAVLFAPGVRFEGEIDPATKARLEEAIAAGVKVVVEADSALDLPGLVKLDDWQLNNYFVGTYFPTWQDDELNKVYQKSQPTVDYLRPKLIEWGVEPAARGNFTVGPTWRDGGDIDYLWMANFDDPAYRHTVKQQMARPTQVSLVVPARHGRVAYDLLAQRRLEVSAPSDAVATPGDAQAEAQPIEPSEVGVTLDMRRLQGALVAFTPEPIQSLAVEHALSDTREAVRLRARLIGASGQSLEAVFPARVTLRAGEQSRTFYRMLGRDLSFELDLPQGGAATSHAIEIREALAGHVVVLNIETPALAGNSLRIEPADQPYLPHPREVVEFAQATQKSGLVKVVVARGLPGAEAAAARLVAGLRQQGVQASVVSEPEAYYLPPGNPQAEDPLGDGFHTWRLGQELIGPATIVDGDVILLGAPRSSTLLDMLSLHGFLSDLPVGEVGRPAQPQIVRAAKGLHYAHDTLCLIAADERGLALAVDAFLRQFPARSHSAKAPSVATAPTLDAHTSGFPRMAQLPELSFAAPATTPSQETLAIDPAVRFAGTNELILDARFDGDGNIYIITWGHGKNLYSFTPDGASRFARFLPEMGANRLDVFDDRLLVYTAAGARLYELGLDGSPRKQARLNMDPGSTHYSDNYQLSHADYQWLPRQKLYVHRLEDRMRVLMKLRHREWRPEEFVDKDVDDKTLRRELYGYAVSPDGQFIAQIEASYYFTKVSYQDAKVYDAHLVVRDLDGRLIAEHLNLDNRSSNGAPGVTARLTWPEGAAGPVIYVEDERIAFSADLRTSESLRLIPGEYRLRGDHRLARDGDTLIYFDEGNHVQCRLGPLATMPSYVELSPAGDLLAMLDEYGALSVFQTADGALRMRQQVEQRGRVLRFTPDGQSLLLGGMRGGVTCFALDGATRWQIVLEPLNDILGTELALHDPAYQDFTPRLWPISQDAPGELEALTRLGENRLVAGDCESDGAWQGNPLAFASPGFESSRALRVGPEMVSQEVKDYLGNHITWVLEFRYKAADAATVNTGEVPPANVPASGVELLAGIMADGDFPDSVARVFRADGQWRFGRVVIKNGAGSQRLVAGFAAAAGDALVDQVSLRRLRFPSVNHLLYEPLYPIKPVVLDNPLYSEQYDPFGNLRDEAPNRVLIENLRTGALNLVESAFLQNGRTNEIGSSWYIQPLDHDPMISLGLREPRWISMVGLYFNVHDEENVTPHFNIYATDVETKEDVLVAAVRHNGQQFRLVKFPPIKTPLVKVELVNSISRLRTITEIELYGPLSGREGSPGFIDADGQNAYMGDFTRVDKRVKQLADYYHKPVTRTGGHAEEIIWHAPLAQVLASEDRLFFGRTLGVNSAVALSEPAKDLYFTRASGLGYTPYGALYGGLIFRCGNDGQFYCIDPESGAQLWSVKLGDRLFGSPVAIGEDLYAPGDNFTLYEIDFASGSVMKEAKLSGNVFGSLATDGERLVFITDDGFLQCLQARDFHGLWKVPVAPYSDSTPAIDAGVVYFADQKGTAQAVRLADGSSVWKTELADEFLRTPVVGPDRVVFGCRSGTLVVLDRATGEIVWKKQVASRFFHEPLLVHSAGQTPAPGDYGGDLLLYFAGAKAVLANLADGRESGFRVGGISADRKPSSPLLPSEWLTLPNEPATPLTFYRGALVALPRTDHAGYQVVNPWHVQGGQYTVLAPIPPAAPEPPAEGENR